MAVAKCHGRFRNSLIAPSVENRPVPRWAHGTWLSACVRMCVTRCKLKYSISHIIENVNIRTWKKFNIFFIESEFFKFYVILIFATMYVETSIMKVRCLKIRASLKLTHFGIAEGEVSVISTGWTSTTSRERVTGVLTFQREPWALLILRQTECKVPFISVNIISMQTGDQKTSFFFYQSPILRELYYMRYVRFIALFT